MEKIGIKFGIILFICRLTHSGANSDAQVSLSYSFSVFGNFITDQSKVIHTERFINQGEFGRIVTKTKTINVDHNIDAIRITAYSGKIEIVEGGYNYKYVKVYSESTATGGPIHTKIEIYSNGAFAKSLSIIALVFLFVTYFTL